MSHIASRFYRYFRGITRVTLPENFKQFKSQNVDNCPCNEGCPNGCPCPVYQCPSSSVLILHTYDAPNTQASVPILADLNGNVDRIGALIVEKFL